MEVMANAINVDFAAYLTVCLRNHEKNPHKLKKNFRSLVLGLGVWSVLNVLLLLGTKESIELFLVMIGVDGFAGSLGGVSWSVW